MKMTKRMTMGLFFSLIFTTAVVTPLFAHHGAATFDTSKKLTLKGTVVEWFWSNPHCFLRFDVKDDSGQLVHWVAEAQSGPNILPAGYTKQTFKPGDQISITLEPVRNGRPLGRMVSVITADGKKLGDMGTVPGAP